jgi:glycosyltransferase involved in cell wall biosynthesis
MVKFTIAIPTFNRSESLLSNLSHILCSDLDVKVIVSDNCSSDSTWVGLNGLVDPRLKVYRNNENLGFTGNIIRLFEECETPYLFIISDEDRVSIEDFKNILSSVKNDDFGAIYTSVKNNSGGLIFNYENKLYDVKEALIAHAFNRSYVSGAIFNTAHFNKKKFLEITGGESLILYPHEILFIMALISSKKMMTLSSVSCRQYYVEDSEYLSLYGYDRLDSRVDLLEQYVRIIEKMDLGLAQKKLLYMALKKFFSGVIINGMLHRDLRKTGLSKLLKSCNKHFGFLFIPLVVQTFIFKALRKLK